MGTMNDIEGNSSRAQRDDGFNVLPSSDRHCDVSPAQRRVCGRTSCHGLFADRCKREEAYLFSSLSILS